MNYTEDEDGVTKDDVINMIIKRQRLWVDASAVIANMLPVAWDVIEGYLAETQNVANLLLNDLRYDSSTEMLTYHVFEEGSTIIYNVPMPLALALQPGLEGEWLAAYFEKLPPLTNVGQPTDTKEDKIKNQLNYTLQQHPGMYMDVDRLAELEMQQAAGEFFKYPVASRLQ